MKIAHVIYIPRFSGAEILVRELATNHSAQGHQVAVFSLMPIEESFVSQQRLLAKMGVFMSFPTQPLGKVGRFQFLAQQLKAFDPDIALGHAVIPSLYTQIATKLAGLSHTSVINVLHDASQDDYASWYFQVLARWIASTPDAVIAVSKRGAQNYARRIPRSTKPHVIPNGIKLEKIIAMRSQRDWVRQHLFSATEKDVVFLQVGRCSRPKQQHLSLQAYVQVSQNYANSKLYFAGIAEDPNYERELKQQVTDLGLEDRVFFLGARSDIPELLAGADVYLMPSHYEAHSVAFVEALASGITIVASDIDSFQYGLDFPGVNLIDPKDCNRFAEAMSKSLSFAAQTRWQRDLKAYSIEQTANTYLNLFETLLKRRNLVHFSETLE